MVIQVAQPATPAAWHAVMQQHIGHELAVDSAYQATTQVVRPQSICYDGRMSVYVELEWCPDLSMRLFFGTRQVTCRTCEPPQHRHLFVIRETYSATDRARFKRGVCACGAAATFAVPVP